MTLNKFCKAILFLFFFFTACIEVPTSGPKQDLAFFDLKSYFNEEIKNLNNIEAVKKSVSINGVVEELTRDSLNFEEEFSVFLASDINRIAWFDKYKVDSLSMNDQLESITYTALDENLKTQSLVIIYEDKQVKQISIKNNRTSLVADSSQDLEYTVGKGYSIVSRQKTTMTDERLLKVVVTF